MSRYGIRVIFADDHPVLTLANRHVVAAVPTIACVGDARNSTELVDLLQRTPCDVLVTDYAMPGGEYGDGRTLISFLTRRYPALKLVVTTMMDNPMVLRSLFGQRIHCVVSKSDDPATWCRPSMPHSVGIAMPRRAWNRCWRPGRSPKAAATTHGCGHSASGNSRWCACSSPA